MKVSTSLHPSSRLASLCCVGLVASLLVGSSAWGETPAESRAWLRRRLDTLRQDPRLGGATIGVLVASPGRKGRVFYAHRADEKVSVASNVKLISSAAALATLGTEYRFQTALYALPRPSKTPAAPGPRPKRRSANPWARISGGVLAGDLCLKGFGDPSLRDTDLWRLARALHAKGLRRVRGSLGLDESYFDHQRLAPEFETRKSDAYYRPANGALSINDNVLRVRVRAGAKEGDKAVVVVTPKSRYLRVRNQVRTVGRGKRSWLTLRTRGFNAKGTLQTRVTVRGRVRLGYLGRAWAKRIEHPGRFTAATFLHLLARRGIVVEGRRIRRCRAPRRARPLHVLRSAPLGALVRRMNKVSSNFMAEQLLKVLGAERYGTPGTWAKGLRVVADYLARLGIKRGSYTLKNGSGLYDASAISPRQLVRVLRAAYHDFRYGPDYLASLPVAAIDGTLARRFVGSGAERYVRAKTGTLAQVVSLSGVAGASKGLRRRLLFSFLVTALPKTRGQIRKARAVVDEMARVLVTYLER